MNGNSLLLDTNIALYLLDGDQTLADILNGRDVYLSFISELELLGYHELKEDDFPRIQDFIGDCIIIDLNQSIKRITIELKRTQKIKLPEAIIAATSMYLNIPLLSADKGF